MSRKPKLTNKQLTDVTDALTAAIQQLALRHNQLCDVVRGLVERIDDSDSSEEE